MIRSHAFLGRGLIALLTLFGLGGPLASVAEAGINQWTSIGPYGAGAVNALAIDPISPSTVSPALPASESTEARMAVRAGRQATTDCRILRSSL